MHVYLLKSFSLRLLNEEVNKIIKDSTNVIRFNYDEISIDDIISECAYYSLIPETKYVIVNNFKLNAESKKLDKYLKEQNQDTVLILITDKIDKRNVIYKAILAIGTIIEVNDLNQRELFTKINDYCQEYNIKINSKAVSKLMDYNLYNYDLIINEIAKIASTYKNIDEDLVEKLSSKLLNPENFDLSEAIINKDKEGISKSLEEFIILKNEVIPLVSLLANQYRLLYAVKMMNGTPDAIAKTLGVHPYRVKLAKEKTRLYNQDEILNNILALSDLDVNLKTMNIDQYSLLKMFLINIC